MVIFGLTVFEIFSPKLIVWPYSFLKYSAIDYDSAIQFRHAVPAHICSSIKPDPLSQFSMKHSIKISGPEDNLVFRKYLDKKSPVTQGVENRIKIYSEKNPSSEAVLSEPGTSAAVKSHLHLINLSLTGFLALLGTALRYI